MSTAPSALREQMRTLYNEHHGWLHAWIRRRLGGSDNAADLAHDTFARLLASRGVPQDLREPRAFLTTVAKGLVSNWRKRRVLEQTYLAALAELPVATVPPPEQRMLVLEALHEIDLMLDELPPKVRHAFLLSQLDGLKYREIALEMRVSEITVKRYMKQAFLQCLTRIGNAVVPE
jgi:RNA polymerase sigma-19 factor, ECF subfamily